MFVEQGTFSIDKNELKTGLKLEKKSRGTTLLADESLQANTFNTL